VIHRVLPRRSAFERKAAGTARALQILAANIDVAFLCMSLNADFNLRRLERYLAVAWGGGATPVIVLTKADLCEDREARLAEVASVSGGAERILCSGLSEEGVREVRGFLAEGRTIAFLGSSGVGKSTLINRLMGREVLATGAVRPGDDRGRHTTTTRQLLLLPGGGVVIDTPGMRELQLDLGDLSRSFEDVEALAARCRYRDCTHEGEPGCAVRAALEAGSLSPGRLENYRKLRKELGYEGLSSREREREKIRNMFGGLGEMKQLMRHAKEQNRNRGRKGR
jgi:ribosome biogenesis GTPase